MVGGRSLFFLLIVSDGWYQPLSKTSDNVCKASVRHSICTSRWCWRQPTELRVTQLKMAWMRGPLQPHLRHAWHGTQLLPAIKRYGFIDVASHPIVQCCTRHHSVHLHLLQGIPHAMGSLASQSLCH